MSRVFAFIDESGNHDLDTAKSSASDYFIVLAIIVKDKDLLAVEKRVEAVKAKHFQKGEMKSNGIKDKDGHSRRIRILNDINNIGFRFYAIAVNKSAVDRDSGLQYKKSFIKFVNGLLYRQLFGNFQDIVCYGDAHGGAEFINSFKLYVDKNHKPDLFWKSHIEVVDSKSNVLVQLADFIVGTIAKVYEGKKNPALSEAYIALLKSKAIRVDEWPTKYQAYYPQDKPSNEFDAFIYKHSLGCAEQFLDRTRDAHDEESRLQYALLSHLVFISRFDPSKSYISTAELLHHLNEVGFGKVTEQTIRSSIIAKLRDNSVIISSCNKGYKIPRSYDDLVDFVERVNGLVIPLLERFNSARSSFDLASGGDVDLLKGPNFPHLVSFLDSLSTNKSRII